MEEPNKDLEIKILNLNKFWNLIKENHKVFVYKKPLQIGIDKVIKELYQNEIKELNISNRDLKRLFKYHVTSFKYLSNLILHKKRYNIDDKPVGIVEDKCKIYAKSHLSYLKAKNKKRLKGSCA